MSSKAKIYLYKEGNECNAITGGWDEASFGIHSSYIRQSVTKGSNSILLNPTNVNSMCLIGCNNLIDFSVFNFVSIDNYCYNAKDNLYTYAAAYFNTSKSFDVGVQTTISLCDIVGRKEINTNIDIIQSYFSVSVANFNNNSGKQNKMEFFNIFLETKDNLININSQNTSSINFSCNNLDNLITITKAEVYINNQLSKTYNDNFDNITYDIDKNLCIIGTNNIKIKVTYTQGDDIYETVEEVLTHTNTVNNLPTSSSLKELIDRQELLTNSIEVQKNTLKSILKSKNVVVSEEENKLSILIQKVNELANNRLYLYNSGDECVNITGGWIEGTHQTNAEISFVKETTSFTVANSAQTTSNCYGYISQSKQFSLLGYSKLKINVLNANSRSNHLSIDLTTTTGTLKKAYISTSGIIEFDVASFNDNCNLTLSVGPFDSTITIDKIWLEK